MEEIIFNIFSRVVTISFCILLPFEIQGGNGALNLSSFGSKSRVGAELCIVIDVCGHSGSSICNNLLFQPLNQ